MGWAYHPAPPLSCRHGHIIPPPPKKSRFPAPWLGYLGILLITPGCLSRPQALTPLVEGIIKKDMERFREYVTTQQQKAKGVAAAAQAPA